VEENEGVVQYALSKRPNIKLVETGLTFGKEGFTAYMGKTFDKKMSMTRRYYPHAYNVDGFFVAKFKKVGPSPSGSGAARSSNGVKVDELDVDKRPIAETDEEDDFGGFSDEEDEKIIERARKIALRKKGIDPKAKKELAKAPKKAEKTNGEVSKSNGKKKETKSK